ncbi:MAG: hypothetical protein BWY32_02564 [bacterium ADurb.Bin243]|nr:MAG: hypothetical protein BWY32_02564 [bacterium ADurb.Bin243]
MLIPVNVTPVEIGRAYSAIYIFQKKRLEFNLLACFFRFANIDYDQRKKIVRSLYEISFKQNGTVKGFTVEFVFTSAPHGIEYKAKPFRLHQLEYRFKSAFKRLRFIIAKKIIKSLIGLNKFKIIQCFASNFENSENIRDFINKIEFQQIQA